MRSSGARAPRCGSDTSLKTVPSPGQNLSDLARIEEITPVSGRFALHLPRPSHRIEPRRCSRGNLVRPNCRKDRNFLVRRLQMHVVNVEGGRVEVSEESRPAVLEVLCDECESALNSEELEDTLRKEVRLTIGAR